MKLEFKYCRNVILIFALADGIKLMRESTEGLDVRDGEEEMFKALYKDALKDFLIDMYDFLCEWEDNGCRIFAEEFEYE